jgi:hypothetical protein
MKMSVAISAQVSPALANAFIAPPENMRYLHKSAHKELNKEAAALSALLADTGEQCLVIALDTSMNSNLVVVTDRRTFQYKRGSVRKEMAHSDVAKTTIGVLPNQDILVEIESHSSRLDYAPNDVDRFQKILMPHVATPRIAQVITAHIDRLAAQPAVTPAAGAQAGPGQPSGDQNATSAADPRTIPVLFPDVYERVLRTVGQPFTADTLGRLVELCSQMVGGGMADDYFRQVGDQAAHDRFTGEFTGAGYRLHGLRIVDDMIDFLWAWNPACRAELSRQVGVMEQMLTSPQSPLRGWSS